jgi:hypothetical protein
MNQRAMMNVWKALLLIGVFFCAANIVHAQTADTGTPERQAADELAASKALRDGNVGTVIPESRPPAFWRDLLPELSAATLTWIAVVVILVLTIQAKPIVCWHNLDGLMLALTALLLPLRGNTSLVRGDPTGHTVQCWVYLLLCAATVYWIIRGLRLLLGKTAPTMTANVSAGAMFVLIAAGLCLAGSRIAGAPLSEGSRDGLTGGICFADTSKLPYGDAPGRESRSPLLYVVHAGATKVVGPAFELDGESLAMKWQNREQWMSDKAWKSVDPAPARLVNAFLFILLIAATAGIGCRLHSMALGQTLVAILCVFPGALECLSHPEILLPAALVAWSILFLTIPGVGGFLAMLTLAFAGLSWAWAWLGMIVVLGYLLRRGWQALGGVVGLCAGIMLIVMGFDAYTAPTLPSATGSQREAGITPAYTARVSEDGTIVIDPYHPDVTVAPTFKKWFWKPLLDREDIRLSTLNLPFAYPSGVDGGAIACNTVLAEGPARAELQKGYRSAMKQEPRLTQTLASIRGVLDATWKAEDAANPETKGVWQLWSETFAGRNWELIRRCAKLAVGVLALFAALVVFREPGPQIPRLLGGLLAVGAAILLVDMTGPATNWIWLMPMILAALAAKSAPPALPPKAALPASPFNAPMGKPPTVIQPGPAPRITVER